jgi:hypothetical protein
LLLFLDLQVLVNLAIVFLTAWLGYSRFQTEQDERKASMRNQAHAIEWAVEFSATKFATTFEAIKRNAVPPSHALLFWYGTEAKAKEALASGLPAIATPTGRELGDRLELKSLFSRKTSLSMLDSERAKQLMKRNSQTTDRNPSCATSGGVFLTLHEPSQLDSADLTVFPLDQREVCLALSVPRSILARPTFKDQETLPPGDSLFVVPGTVLRALRPSGFLNVLDPAPWYRGELLLPSKNIVRAYKIEDTSGAHGVVFEQENDDLLMDDGFGFGKSISAQPASFARQRGSKLVRSPNLTILKPRTIKEFLEKMTEIRSLCAERGLVPLYHFTQPYLGPLIVKTGFRMSTQGQGDGGVYFSTLGPSSYELGSTMYEENIIIDCFGASRLEEYLGKHKLDLCLVYGAEPGSLMQAPGGRDNARVVPKANFTSLSLPDETGNYFLRPDRIMGMFLINPDDPPTGYAASGESLNCEQNCDLATKDALTEHMRSVDDIERRVRFECVPSSGGSF